MKILMMSFTELNFNKMRAHTHKRAHVLKQLPHRYAHTQSHGGVQTHWLDFDIISNLEANCMHFKSCMEYESAVNTNNNDT